MRPEQNGRYFADDVLKSIFATEICVFGFKFHSPKFIPKGSVRQQTITLTIVDQDLGRHMVSLGRNEFIGFMRVIWLDANKTMN